MAQIPDGQLIEAVLFHLDTDSIINPKFQCPAVSVTQLASSLGVAPATVDSRQVVDAIAPLAETLFPTARIPIPKVHQGERWIIFHERHPTLQPDLALAHKTEAIRVEQKKKNRRITLKSYYPPQDPQSQPSTPALPTSSDPRSAGSAGLRKLRLGPSEATTSVPSLPSAPLRQTSSGELTMDVRLDVNPQPRSAVASGKKSFLRPFLLKGRKKVEPTALDMPSPVLASHLESRPMLSEMNHAQKRPEDLESMIVVANAKPGHVGGGKRLVDPLLTRPVASAFVDDYLHVEIPESPYEETAFISMDDSPAPPRTATKNRPVEKSKAESIAQPMQATPASLTTLDPPQVAHAREITGASPTTPQEAHTEISPSTPRIPITPESAVSTALGPKTSSHTSRRDTSPIEPSSPVTAAATVTLAMPPHPVTAPPARRPHDHLQRSALPERHQRDRRAERLERPKEAKSESRSSRTEVESRSRSHRDRESRHSEREREWSRASRPKARVRRTAAAEEESWLEILLQDLPFGPDKRMFQALESIKKDWRIFLAELMALLSLAYMVQASGW